MTGSTDREALGLLIERTIYGSEAHAEPSSFGLALADAILAAGWRAPEAEHEHEWIDPRDLVFPPEFCAICHEWKADD